MTKELDATQLALIEAHRKGDGQFGERTREMPETTMDSVATRERERAEAAAERTKQEYLELEDMEVAIKDRHADLRVKYFDQQVALMFPEATTVDLERARSDSFYQVGAIKNGDTVIWDAETNEGRRYPDDVRELNGIIASAGERVQRFGVAGSAIGQDRWATLRVGDAQKQPNVSVAEVITGGDREKLGRLASHAEGALWSVGARWDKTEIEHRLENAPNYEMGLPAGTMERLDGRFDGRENALEALAKTDAWADADEALNESAYSIVNAAVAKAVAELDAE